MATPTITSISPNAGHSGGQTLVRITGTGFQITPPPIANPTGKLPAPSPPVRVLFDGVHANHVRVFSDTEIYCQSPRHAADGWSFVAANGTSRPAPSSAPATIPKGFTLTQTSFGVVDVTVQNIDPSGVLIGSEEVTLAQAFTFKRPRLDGQGNLFLVLEAFEELMRNDVLPNVAFNPSVDYDTGSGMMLGFIGLAELPGIAITEVSIVPSEDSRKEKIEVDGGNGLVIVRRPPIKKDIFLTLAMVSTRIDELTSLIELVEHHFTTNEGVTVLRDPNDASKGTITYPYLTDPSGSQFSGRIGRTDQMVATYAVSIQQVLLEAPPGLDFGTFTDAPDWLTHAGTIDVTKKMANYSLRKSHL